MRGRYENGTTALAFAAIALAAAVACTQGPAPAQTADAIYTGG